MIKKKGKFQIPENKQNEKNELNKNSKILFAP